MKLEMLKLKFHLFNRLCENTNLHEKSAVYLLDTGVVALWLWMGQICSSREFEWKKKLFRILLEILECNIFVVLEGLSGEI